MTASDASAASFIAKIPYFAGLPENLLPTLADAFVPVQFHDGEIVINEGQTPQIFAVVTSGTFDVMKQGKHHSTLESGDFFGFRNLFGDHRASGTVVARKQATALQLKRSDLEHVLTSHPELVVPLLRSLSTHLPDGNSAASIPRVQSLDALNTSAAPDLQQQAALPRKLTVRVFDNKPYHQTPFVRENQRGGFDYKLEFRDEKLSADTAHLAAGAHAVVAFVHDTVDKAVAKQLKEQGVGLVAYRCAGTEKCDVEACDELGISVANVPAYSPNAVAEHAVTLMMALNRKIVWANSRVHTGDFSLDGLVGFDMKGKTVGVIGTGKIGYSLTQILLGFGCRVICYDVYKNPSLLANPLIRYVELDELFTSSDIISLHAPLTPQTKHTLNAAAFKKMKRGVMIINTSRGPLIDTPALIEALKSGQVGACGLDVVEGEDDLFYEDKSEQVLENDVVGRLLSFHNNVIMTAHQAYLTEEALREIALTTLRNIQEYQEGKRMKELSNSINKSSKA
ncbi:hypothetical protein RI367_001002 [Sorochytrium milnesiophthora]